MFLVILLTLFIIAVSAVTTIPFSVGLLAVATVLFKKPWVFFLALGLGLFLDLILIRTLGYTALVFVIFVFLIRLYERKFETQTTAFVFIATFLGSLVYMGMFSFQQIFLQSLINSLLGVLTFKIIQNSKGKNQNFGSTSSPF